MAQKPGPSRDSISPISKLPPELLLIIFKHVHIGDRSCFDHDNRDCCSTPMFQEDKWVDIIVVSHVCHKWRSISLNCPDLWSRIIFSNPLITEEMISRSMSSPLSLAIMGYHTKTIDLLSPSSKSKLLDMGRLWELHLSRSLPEEWLDLYLGDMTGTSFPRLHSIYIGRGYTGPPNCTIPITLTLPMPRTRHLSLSNCVLQFSALRHFTSLISLSLYNIASESRKQFYAFLASNPGLETLTFISALPKPSDEIIRSFRLPKLSFCTISEATGFWECADFQAHVSYPVDTAKLYFGPSEADESDIPAAKALVSSLCSPSSPRSYMVFELQSQGPRILFSQFPFKSLRDESPIDNRDHLSATIELIGFGMTPRSLLLHALSIPALKGLYIGADCFCESSECPADAWLSFFKRHPTIQSLSVYYSMISPVLTALLDALLEYTPCLPNLSSLTIYCCSPWPSDNLFEDCRLLHRYLTCRRRTGEGRLMHLIVTDCQEIMTREQVSKLREAVEVLEWYGCYRRPDEKETDEEETDEEEAGESTDEEGTYEETGEEVTEEREESVNRGGTGGESSNEEGETDEDVAQV